MYKPTCKKCGHPHYNFQKCFTGERIEPGKEFDTPDALPPKAVPPGSLKPFGKLGNTGNPFGPPVN